MTQAPKHFRMMWRDGAFVPENRIKQWCEDTFGEGEVVTFDRIEERSVKSHNHFFASVVTAWENLPDTDERFPTPDALRKWALIRNGFCTEHTVVADSPQQAATIAAFTGKSEGTIIVVRENVVKKYTALSQRMTGPNAMSKEDFQRSKDLVLDTIAELIEVKRKRLEENAGRAA